jgi:hypothetical protein
VDLTVRRVIRPDKYWQWVNKITQLPAAKEFCEVMESIFVCPSSSAGLERVFSSFGLVHTKLRNRLANDRVAKLVKIYCTLRGEDMIDNIDELELCKTDQ